MGGLSAMHANRDRRLRRKAMPERLADSLMDLVRHGCFSSIDVAMIAAKTGLSRKSFYYHFSGKDELMQHALKREIGSLCMERRGWDMLVSLLRLLYADRRFYRSIHADAGSTMAMVRLRELLLPMLVDASESILAYPPGSPEAMVMADIMYASISRWISLADPPEPFEFLCSFRDSIVNLSETCLKRLSSE